ncbi:MAG TPA: ATP-binding protein [Chthoniobacterales bacterium]|nr:ATP-binding protein [Chthoniobacterales bacterium]
MSASGPILLVEDDPNDVELTLTALEDYHLANDVVVAGDGAEALDYLYRRGAFASRANGGPAVMLLDLNLPKVNGLEVLQQVKADESLRMIPVVVLTSSSEERDMVASYRLGVSAFVVKPVDFRDFVDTIRELGVLRALREAKERANLAKAQEALRRSEAYSAEAQKLSHTGSFGWEVSSGKIYWSEETFRIFECDVSIEPTLDLILQRTHPEDRALVREVLDHVTHARKDFDVEHRLLMPDGSVRYLRVVGRLSVNESGSLECVGAVADITERERAELKMRQMHAELAHMTRVMTVGEMTASIAHEISQPLAAIVTNGNAGLRWLSADSPDLEQTSQAIRRIIRDGKRASEVVSRTGALFKKAPAMQEPLEINEVIQEVLTLTQNEVQGNGVLLRTRLASDLPLVMGDRVQLQQVILNLILNAIQAMDGVTEGSRELELISEKAYPSRRESKAENSEKTDLASARCTEVLITARDSGPGFDSENIDRLFNAFYTTKPHGLGMGLSISRSIIEAHGGRLWAKANSPRGAVFQFALPTRAADSAS